MRVMWSWPLSQTAKTSPSHGEDMGSIPVGVTNLVGFLPALLKQVSFSRLVYGSAGNILCAALAPLRVEEILQCSPKRNRCVDGFFFCLLIVA